MAQQIYTPIVKGKMYDLKALNKLSPLAKTRIKPLVEAMPKPAEVSLDEHLEKLVHYLVKYYPKGDLFVDFYGLLPDEKTTQGISGVIAGCRLMMAKGRAVTPCYGFSRDDSIWQEMSKVVTDLGRGFCFRIDVDDLDDAAQDTWAQIIERSAELGLDAPQIDLVIDLRDVRDVEKTHLQDLCLDFLATNPSWPKYRSISVVGSSALKSVGKIPVDGFDDIERNELHVWALLQFELGPTKKLVFGDYGVVHPDFSDAVNNKNKNSKIRYTSGSKIRYFRGHRLADPPGFKHYHVLAERVRSSDLYRGRDFSFGDQYIDDCADLNSGSGNLPTWVLADMNHHLEYSAAQIARLNTQILAVENVEAAEELVSAD